MAPRPIRSRFMTGHDRPRVDLLIDESLIQKVWILTYIFYCQGHRNHTRMLRRLQPKLQKVSFFDFYFFKNDFLFYKSKQTWNFLKRWIFVRLLVSHK